MRAIRVDAQASGQRTGAGGWYPEVDSNGTPDEREHMPSRVISALEALGFLVALKLKYGDEPTTHRSKITIAPTITDNRRNGAVPQQANDFQVPIIRVPHGNVSVHEKDGSQGSG